MFDYADILNEFRIAARDRGFWSKDSKALMIRNNTVVRRGSCFFVPNCCGVTASGHREVRTLFLDLIRVQYGEEAASALAETLVGRDRRKSTHLGAKEVRRAFIAARNRARITATAAAAKAGEAGKNAGIDQRYVLNEAKWPVYQNLFTWNGYNDSEVRRWLEVDLKIRHSFNIIRANEPIYYTHQLIYNEMLRLHAYEATEDVTTFTAASAAFNVFSNRISDHAANANPMQAEDDSSVTDNSNNNDSLMSEQEGTTEQLPYS